MGWWRADRGGGALQGADRGGRGLWRAEEGLRGCSGQGQARVGARSQGGTVVSGGNGQGGVCTDARVLCVGLCLCMLDVEQAHGCVLYV